MTPQLASMESNKLSFLDNNQSIASLITQLHSYFRDSHARHKVKRSDLVSRLEAATGEEETQLFQELQMADSEIALFGVLSDSLSIADRVLHTPIVMEALGREELYQFHYETEEEQAAEREAARRAMESNT